ncbi:MAG TPA: phosphoribosylglycinamide formyltransferase, partial [Actinobacteria bacterium]|nr:phosphoribosylglycinamide formyltransferase [Actinomycetota bacterium]
MRKKIAVFASGFGSNLQALIDFNEKSDLGGDISLVFSNNSDAFALKRAEKHNIKAASIDPGEYPNREEFEKDILRVLDECKIDLIVLAGYMFLLTPLLINTYKDRILNIHPALLPSFKGTHGIKDAYDYGVRISGVTVHFVDEELDNGPIIMQAPVYIDKKDSLERFEEKIHEVEHKIYPQAVKLFCQ